MALLPSILSAFHHGVGLQHLKRLSFCGCLLDNAGTMGAIPTEFGLPCLDELSFDVCYFGPQGMPALAELLERDAFRSLKKLNIIRCPEVGDEGVVRLAQALMASTRTRLTQLWLECIEIGDLGMAELANLVRRDRCRTLTRLTLSEYYITDEGVLALAEAIGQGPIWEDLRQFHLKHRGNSQLLTLGSWSLLFYTNVLIL
jgi:hypothetical protein